MITTPTDKRSTAGYTVPTDDALAEQTIAINRISRTVKGGRRIRFRALVVVGNRHGRVGLAMEKGNDVQSAIAKAKRRAEKSAIDINLIDGTIAHEVCVTYGTTKVLLKPAKQGHSIIAGGAVRAVCELAGVRNIVSKTLGSSNALNAAMATLLALQSVGVRAKKS